MIRSTPGTGVGKSTTPVRWEGPADGTYDIDYDDGKETRVEGRLLRRRAAATRPRAVAVASGGHLATFGSGRGRGGRPRPDGGRARRRLRTSGRAFARATASRPGSGGEELHYRGPSGRTGRRYPTCRDGATETRVREDHIRSRKDDDGPDLRSGVPCERGIEAGTSGTPALSRESTPMAPLTPTMTMGKANETSGQSCPRRVGEVGCSLTPMMMKPGNCAEAP